MIIKSADNKRAQLAELQALQSHPSASANTKNRIEQETRKIQAGERGEKEAAYEMKVHFGESMNWMVIHDLRIEHDGFVAQIDHLIINRTLEMWICESKHFSEGVSINAHGEFAGFFRGKPYGVPSPIEQNNRHILILNRMFDSGAIELPTRLGFTIKPELKSLVLISKNARISRPRAKIEGIEAIIKNDQLLKAIKKTRNKSNLVLIAKIVGQDTLRSFAKKLAKLHKPIKFDWAAKFGLIVEPAETIRIAVTAPVPTLDFPRNGRQTRTSN